MGRVRNSLVGGTLLGSSRPVCSHMYSPNHPHLLHLLLLHLNSPRLRSVKVGNHFHLSHLASSSPIPAWHQEYEWVSLFIQPVPVHSAGCLLFTLKAASEAPYSTLEVPKASKPRTLTSWKLKVSCGVKILTHKSV